MKFTILTIMVVAYSMTFCGGPTAEHSHGDGPAHSHEDESHSHGEDAHSHDGESHAHDDDHEHFHQEEFSTDSASTKDVHEGVAGHP